MNKLKRLFHAQKPVLDAHANEAQQLNITAATILLQLMTVDNHSDEEEIRTIRHVLIEDFGISSTELDELLEQAHVKQQHTHDVFSLTTLIKEKWSEPERARLVQHMYQVAMADGRMDDLEQHLISKVAKLLYVSRDLHVLAKRQALASC